MVEGMFKAALDLCKIAFALVAGGVSLVIIVCVIVLVIAVASVAVLTAKEHLEDKGNKRDREDWDDD